MAIAVRASDALAGRILPEPGDDLTIVDEADLAVREVLEGDFHFEGFLGQGGMSVVFLVRELNLHRLVALKVLPKRSMKESSSAERFKQEAMIAASLDHPNIVPIHRFGSTPRCLWYTMKYIRGRSLAELLHDVGPLDLHDCFNLIEQIAGALSYAHRRDVVHRDMKPANVMLDENGWAYVCDFGVAKALGNPRLTQTGGTLGTPLYMSPEQLYGQELDGRSDQYALAVMTFELLTGRNPFAAESVGEIIQKHCSEQAPSVLDIRPDLPARVADGLAKAMSKRPADRFDDVTEFLTAMGGRRPRHAPPSHRLESAIGAATTAPLRKSVRERRLRGRGLMLAAAAMAVVAGAVVVGPSLLGGPPVTPPRTGEAVPPMTDPAPPTPMPVPGRLWISAEPWADVIVDGTKVGRTPVIGVAIAPGRHQVRLEHDGYEPFEREITVEPGAEVRLTGLRMQARRP
ncbi:MAG TPA: serine/threonine-protein kinase [Gemmatimonadales bacterium]|jgi:serine/threonine-protein kinase